jgi:elongation factor P
MPSISEFRRGMAIMFNDEIYLIAEYQHVKPGKGGAFIRTKLKNFKTGRVIDNTFRPTDKMESVRLEANEMQYVYNDGLSYYFMDMETYDQIPIPDELVGESAKFLKEGMIAKLLFHGEVPMSVELPTTVDLKVTESEPAVRGDTAGNLTKEVTVETGAKLQVPPFVKQGDIIRVDTRDGSYVSRV